jgi:hypothetical protein
MTVVAIDAEIESSSDDAGAAAPREGEATMSGRQRLAGNRQAARRAIAAANENGTTARPRAKPDGKESPLTSLKNQSVIRAFAILKSFYHPDEWVAACELSRRAKIHEATVNRFMQSLVDVGAVVRDEDGRYRCVLFVMPGAQNGAFVNRRENSKNGPESLSAN